MYAPRPAGSGGLGDAIVPIQFCGLIRGCLIVLGGDVGRIVEHAVGVGNAQYVAGQGRLVSR